MYIPKHFNVPAKQTLLSLLPEASFASLITVGSDGIPLATHLPFVYRPEQGEYGTLIAHMARANTHWQVFGAAQSLIVFTGPHAYISPRFYASDLNVPTWNYVAVHAYGFPQIIDQPSRVREVLAQLTADNETGRNNPWSMEEMDDKRAAAMMKAIVAFEIPITRLEAKAKLGQNKSAEDQAAVTTAIGTLWSVD